ncbi:ATP-binding protein [Rubrivivax benzoatilyticus]|uniref:histidine kinase n=1 Tax=Rubrivivax benzoatilyticus TaxID=316997 RepID=A0ABX0HY55_9BURK|nr:ATP-binding protein [Rubrivivax benzoatilyticus]EGJ09876.1 sensor protein qseC [Rubrivivax benzoatilyticus JA2 = ATCC BAA-35]NHK99528.1 two-component sensor histidine kinase [Rubrivivax benzoatilyticus]NHL25402.1 two-component sensor histidine kinase [Rubrivivax benzoatilyticus]
MSGDAGRRPQSLQRRLLLAVLVAAPLLWAITVGVATDSAQTEVDEMFDSELIRLAGTVHGALSGMAAKGELTEIELKPPAEGGTGAAELEDMGLAAWDGDGRPLLYDEQGARLPWRRDASGFVDLQVDGIAWRVYYQQAADGRWSVAAAQRQEERDELIWGLLSGQLAPWLLMLPALLLALAWASRRALEPVRRIAGDLEGRDADSLRPLPLDETPSELRPIVGSMNALFERIEAARQRERRFTADAAHELRTPLALLRAQWDVARNSSDPGERAHAEGRLEAGIARMDRLVSQMLALSRVEAAEGLPQRRPVDWVPIVGQVMSDTLPLAERRRIELGCDWPEPPAQPLPLDGDPALLEILLRNLVDNATRYAPEGGSVTVVFEPDALRVENDGPPLAPELLQRLGERFRRPEGQAESGSGLGVSIVQRIAVLHGLEMRYGARADGTGVVARVGRVATGPAEHRGHRDAR